MGKRGPLPKKKALRVMTGQLPVTKANGIDSNIVAFDPPDMPDILSDKEKEIWIHTVELLRPLRVLEKIDGAVLASYCCSYVRWREAEEQLQNESLTIDGANGNLVTNPLVNISRHERSALVMYAQQLGMTPAARMRVHIVREQPKENPFEKIKKAKDVKLGSKSSKIRKVSTEQKPKK